MTTTNIETLKSALLELAEYKTESDLGGIEEIVDNENDRRELLTFLQTLRKDCVVAKNSTYGSVKEKYEAREKALEKAIDIVYLY
jgi:hypothetical protein